jgi:hypothetical protein
MIKTIKTIPEGMDISYSVKFFVPLSRLSRYYQAPTVSTIKNQSIMITERELRCIELQYFVKEHMKEDDGKDAAAFIAGLIRLTKYLNELSFQNFCEYLHDYIYQDESEECFLNVLEQNINNGTYSKDAADNLKSGTLPFD